MRQTMPSSSTLRRNVIFRSAASGSDWRSSGHAPHIVDLSSLTRADSRAANRRNAVGSFSLGLGSLPRRACPQSRVRMAGGFLACIFASFTATVYLASSDNLSSLPSFFGFIPSSRAICTCSCVRRNFRFASIQGCIISLRTCDLQIGSMERRHDCRIIPL
jgi:hypothetical protein